MSTFAYPLKWPDGWPRTEFHREAKFKTSYDKACGGLMRELDLLGAQDVVITTNCPLKPDGWPRVSHRPEDTGVAAYFNRAGDEQCIPSDAYFELRDNVQAIRLTVAALRGIERWGTKYTVDAAFRGFTALPPPTQEKPKRPWWEVFGVTHDAPVSVRKAVYKALAQELHPDKGGDPEAWRELAEAREEAF